MALDPNMVAALTSGTGYFITLIEIIALPEKGGDAIRLAVNSRDYAFQGDTFAAFPFNTSKFQMKSGVEADNATVKHILQDSFSRINVSGGKWAGATVNVYVVDFLHPEWGWARKHIGRLGEVTTGGFGAETEFRGLMQLISQDVGDKTSGLCRYDLGDGDCTLDLSPFTFPGVVTSVATKQLFNGSLDLTLPSNNGLQVSYYNGTNFETFVASRVDSYIDYVFTGSRPYPGVGTTNYSIRWESKVQPEFTEPHTFHIFHDDGARVWVNGSLIIDQWGTYGATHSSSPIALTAGTKYTIRVDYFQSSFAAGPNPSYVNLKWSSASIPTPVVIPANRFFNESFTNTTNYFEKGKVIWTSGNNVGLGMEVASNDTDEFTLFMPMPGEIQIGDGFEMIAGDTKDLFTCWSKFNNAINFGGEDDIPKPEAVYAVPN